MRLLLIRLFKLGQWNSQGHSLPGISVAFQKGSFFHGSCLSMVPKKQERMEFEEAGSQLGILLLSQAWRNSKADASSFGIDRLSVSVRR